MRILLLSSALFLVPALVPAAALAHGDRPSFEAESGPYLIDIGYDVAGFRPNEEVEFDFDLYENADTVPSFADFELIRVEVSRDGEVVHKEELENQESFIPTMKYAFPEAGQYALDVLYVQSGSVIADASFDVPVAENAGATARAAGVMTYVIAALLVAFGAVVATKSYLRAKKA